MMPSSAWAPPTIRTERLVIRPFTVEDLESVHGYARAYPAAVYGSWLGGNGPDDVARYLADTIARYGRPPRADLGVTAEGRLVGGVGYRQVWITPPTVEIGWVLRPEAAGKGLAREAIGALLGYLFANFPDMSRAEARVNAGDKNGVRLLEHFGFVREGVLRASAGEAGDVCLYGLLRSEWKG
ncbi:MAG: GNAT family N-acetyltransferase [Myxococcota bacterium]